jgi:hypothetical protein
VRCRGTLQARNMYRIWFLGLESRKYLGILTSIERLSILGSEGCQLANPTPVPIQCPQSLQLDQEFVDELIKALEHSMAAWINEGMDSQKMYLLWGRKEPRKDGALFHKTLHLWHYLLLPVADHRKALTRLLLSDHGLALEQMRQGYVYIPCDQRLCRLCENFIESPEHALLECRASSQLITLCEVFTQEICQQMPVFLSPQRPHSTLESLKLIIANRATISLVARYTYDVLQLFDSFPMYSPSASPRQP